MALWNNRPQNIDYHDSASTTSLHGLKKDKK